MNIKIALCAVLASGLLMGCKKELQPQESTADTTAVATSDAPQIAAPASEAAPQIQQAPVSQQVQTAPQQAAKTAPGMNPPHGQPGHRCDISVGAPLSSAPAKPASQMPQTITPAPAQTVTQPQATTQAPAILNAPAQATTAPGMNPPHGQPGHRCDVSVGAPLPKA